MTTNGTDPTEGQGKAGGDRTVKRPNNWDKAVEAARLWTLLDNLTDVAASAGVGYRTLRRWVVSSWWPDAVLEAKKHWLTQLEAEAMRALMRGVQGGDLERAFRILERMNPELRPPVQEHRVGLFAFIQTLPPETVRHLQSLPEGERKLELQKLMAHAGTQQLLEGK